MLNPWLAIVVALGTLLAILGLLHAWRRARPANAELTRKLMHISLGLITLSFPWLFGQTWPVFVWTGAIVVWLLLMRNLALLKSRLGGVIHSVSRQSWGEIYFPIGVAILFVLAEGDPVLYCIPIAILTFADTAAALVGTQYGRWRYTTLEGNKKSAEGSVAFFMVAFFGAHVPLLLFTQTGRAEALLIALILGLLVTLFEAIAWRGLDNLFIPIGGFVLLREFLDMGVGELSVQLGIVAAVATIALVWRGQTTLDDSALLAAVLAGYTIWVLGGWQWVVLPLILFLRGRPLRAAGQPSESHFHHVDVVLSVTGPGLVWLFLAKTLGRPDLFYPFAVTFAVHLAVFEIAQLKMAIAWRSAVTVGIACALRGWLMLFLPYVLIEGLGAGAIVRALLALPVVALASVGFCATQRQLAALPTDAMRWARQAAWSVVGSLIAVLPILALSQR